MASSADKVQSAELSQASVAMASEMETEMELEAGEVDDAFSQTVHQLQVIHQTIIGGECRCVCGGRGEVPVSRDESNHTHFRGGRI